MGGARAHQTTTRAVKHTQEPSVQVFTEHMTDVAEMTTAQSGPLPHEVLEAMMLEGWIDIMETGEADPARHTGGMCGTGAAAHVEETLKMKRAYQYQEETLFRSLTYRSSSSTSLTGPLLVTSNNRSEIEV